MSQTESTPLFDGAKAAGNAAKDMISSVFTKENMNTAKENIGAISQAAKDKLGDLRHSASNGDLSIRLFALAGGVALVVSAGFGLLGLLLTFQITNLILEVYTLILGVVMLLLESQGILRKQHEQMSAEQRQGISTQVTFTENLFRKISKYAFFLNFVWGRGGLYVVAGSLQLAQAGFWSLVIGGFVMLVGVMYIIVGHQTASKLTALRNSLAEQTLKSKFEESDKEGDGKLSPEDFQRLTESLGMNLTRREREVAFLCMDREDKGAITFTDFTRWWSDWEGGPIV